SAAPRNESADPPPSTAASAATASCAQPGMTSHAIPVPNPAARLADSPGNTCADPACPGPRRPVLAASSASISSAAASRTPASSSAVSSSCPGGGVHDSGSQYSCGASDGSSSCAHSRSSHASRSAAVIGSRSGQAGSSSRPGSAGAGTEGMDHIRSAGVLFFEHDTVSDLRLPACIQCFEYNDYCYQWGTGNRCYHERQATHVNQSRTRHLDS